MYLCLNVLFEIVLFICIKMDLALNKLQWFIVHKSKANQTKQDNKKHMELKQDWNKTRMWTAVLNKS